MKLTKSDNLHDEARHLTPSELLQELFQRVAIAEIYSDPKTWADIIYKSSPNDIIDAYKAADIKSRKDLQDFVETYFTVDPQINNDSKIIAIGKATKSLDEYISTTWKSLARPAHDGSDSLSLLGLPYPYIVPGGRFGEIYYWDSYFTMLGFAGKDRFVIDNMVKNFAHMINKYGHIPNGNRTYFLSRSQPPFFHCLLSLQHPELPARAYANYISELETEYKYWMDRAHDLTECRAVKLGDADVLNRYYDMKDTPRDECYVLDIETAKTSNLPKGQIYRNIRAAAESGWDFSSRWFGTNNDLSSIRTISILPIDLNSTLYGMEIAISDGFAYLEQSEKSSEYAAYAKKRRDLIDKFMWDSESGLYFDYDLDNKRKTPIISAATLYPLFFGCCSEFQAQKVAEQVEKLLLKEGGIVTTTIETGEQWDSPNGWAPLQWIAVQGLNRYGYNDLANEIAHRWIKTVTQIYHDSGILYEKYDVVNLKAATGGEYKVQHGFGWTNGVTSALKSNLQNNFNN